MTSKNSGHYTVLARRFRPQTIDGIVGQQHIAQALTNAVNNDRVAHAYLFTGARGVGKTSTARILAKMLNCPEGTNGVPCNTCEICEGIAAGHDVDVLEIDGASNRGIDDIRLLRANVNVKSMRSRFKVYIIDEVHMLTREAFNALLKTLEEPPAGVKFVFCTTEPNKLPDTILSRCQRFDFAAISTSQIAERLSEIAKLEGYDVEPAAIELLARRAAGSMRDSQSLLDQLLAFGSKRITERDVHRLLGTADDDRLIALFDAAVRRDAAATLCLIDRALEEGCQLDELLNQLIACSRDLMVIATGASSVPLLGVSESSRERLEQQADQWKLPTILAVLQILDETKSRFQRSSEGRALVELAVVRVSCLQDLQRIDVLIQALENGDAVKPSATGRGAVPVPTPQKKTSEELPKNSESAPSEQSKAVEKVPFEAGNERQFLSQLMSQLNDMARMHVKGAREAAISEPNLLALAFPGSYHFSKTYCERPEILRRLETVATEIAGRPVRISLLMAEAEGESDDSPSPPEPAAKVKSDNPEPDSFVREAVSLFGGRLVRVDKSPVQFRSASENP